jgi:hypothetical protein
MRRNPHFVLVIAGSSLAGLSLGRRSEVTHEVISSTGDSVKTT